MIAKEIIESTPVPLPVVKEMLEELGKEYELTREQKLILEHISKFVKLSAKEAMELTDKIEEIVGDRRIAVHIVNIMPEDLVELHALLSKEKVSLGKEEMKKFSKLLKNIRKLNSM